MEIQIQIVQVDKQTKTTSAGKPYVALELAFKNLSTGKLESKKIMPFGVTGPTHQTLVGANQGDIFTITSEKNASSGYWDWTKATQAPPGATVDTVQPKTTGYTAPKSTYETPEERAKKQVYIIKQSSLSAAIQVLSIGAKTPPKTEDLTTMAQHFTDWVLAQERAFTKPTALIDMPSDFEDVQ
jgi:hypothetical protein